MPCGANLVRSGEGQAAVEVAASTLPSLRQFMRLHTDIDTATGDQTMFFIVTFILPGPPALSFVILFKRSVKRGLDRAFDRLFARFLGGDDEFKNSRFKFACRLLSAPWILTATVTSLGGVKPTILGRKLRTEYAFDEGSARGGEGGGAVEPRYLEASVYVTSSVVARQIFSLVAGGAPKIAMEFAFFLEGKEEVELPERLMACFRLCHASVDTMATTFPA